MNSSTANWGGARPNPGQKHKWRKGDTKAVRIPVAILDDVLNYAQLLDQENSAQELLSCDVPESLENVHKYNNIKALITIWRQKANRTSNPKWHHAKTLLDALSDEIRR